MATLDDYIFGAPAGLSTLDYRLYDDLLAPLTGWVTTPVAVVGAGTTGGYHAQAAVDNALSLSVRFVHWSLAGQATPLGDPEQIRLGAGGTATPPTSPAPDWGLTIGPPLTDLSQNGLTAGDNLLLLGASGWVHVRADVTDNADGTPVDLLTGNKGGPYLCEMAFAAPGMNLLPGNWQQAAWYPLPNNPSPAVYARLFVSAPDLLAALGLPASPGYLPAYVRAAGSVAGRAQGFLIIR